MCTLGKRTSLWLGVVVALVVWSSAFARDAVVARAHPVAADNPVPRQCDRLVYLSESFEESVPPAGWTLMTSGEATTWERSNATAHSGSYSAAVIYGPSGAWQDEWLVTPALDFTGSAGATLEFSETGSYWLDYGLRHSIAVSTTVPDDPAAFTNLAVWTPQNHGMGEYSDDPVQFDLSAYVGHASVYIAWRYEGDCADDWYLDDVSIAEVSPHDVAALDVLPHGHVAGGVPFQPQGVVKNVGYNTDSFAVRYELMLEDAVIYSETAAVTGLAPDSVATVDFPLATAAAGLYYTTKLTTLLTGDQDPANDIALGDLDTYPLGHTPILFLFTNSGSAPCVPANQAMNAYLPDQGNAVALMRIHTSYPYTLDMLYENNPAQCVDFVVDIGPGSVPSFWLDGCNRLGGDGASAVAACEEAKSWASPLRVTPVYWNSATEQLTVEVEVLAPLPPGGDYRLVSCFTEDGVVHNGGNGDPIHNQAFLWAYPGIEGIPIGTATGMHQYVIDMPLNPNDNPLIPWAYPALRATCYVQDRSEAASRKIYEAGTRFLTEIDDVTAVALSFFELRARPGAVDIRWESLNAGDFRLLRGLDGVQNEVPFSAGAGGSYTATDRLPAGGEARYQLLGREAGEDWLLLRSEDIAVEPALLVTRLERCRPNPFNPKTTIRYTLAAAGEVRLDIFDLQGRRVAALFAGAQTAGSHELSWDAGDLGSGIYFVRLAASGVSDSQKVVLTK